MYQLASELGVTSAEVLARLEGMGESARSAALALPPAVERRLREMTWTPGAAVQPQEGFDPGPDLVTAREASKYLPIRPATVRQWEHRGYVQSVGRRERAKTYQLSALQAAFEDRRAAALPRARVNVPAKHFDAMVSGPEAAALLGVAQSTLRMWVKRGRLTRDAGTDRRPQYRLESIMNASRRPITRH